MQALVTQNTKSSMKLDDGLIDVQVLLVVNGDRIDEAKSDMKYCSSSGATPA
jgi:hypothetical protein